MIPNSFSVEGFKNVKCSVCEEIKTCLCISFNGWHEGDRFTICMDCAQKELDESF